MSMMDFSEVKKNTESQNSREQSRGHELRVNNHFNQNDSSKHSLSKLSL